MLKAELTGKVAIVTAGGGAVGEVISKTFACSGAKVAICDKDYNKAAAVAAVIQSTGGEASAFELDICKKETFKGVCDKIVAKYGKIDILINNENQVVRPEDRKPLHEFDEEKCLEIMQTGLDGMYYFSKTAMQHMAKHNSGSVVNITSIIGMIPAANQTPVVAVASGTIGFTKMWGVELCESHIRVNAIAAGVVRDEKNADFLATKEQVDGKLSHLGVKRLALPEDIANAALFLASDEASYITGTILPVDGGLNAGYVRSF